MATTTTNYGFDVPTSSDLVKNGATAISTLGQDIDTFLNRPLTRNFAINGGFDFWQRSTSSSSNNGYFTADRWAQYNSAGSGTYAQPTSAPSGQRYAMRFTSSANGTLPGLYMAFETSDVVRLAGQTVTVSVWLKSSGSVQGNIQLNSATGTDQAWNTTFTLISTTSVTTTTSWARYSGQFAVPSNATSLRLDIYSGAVANAGTFEIGGVQLELGNQMTPFQRAGGTIQGELAACQRYYTREKVTNNYCYLKGFGNATTTTLARIIVPFPVEMRVKPTSMDKGASLAVSDGANLYSTGTFVLSTNCTTQSAQVEYTHGSAVFTQFRYYGLQDENTGATYLGFSAEL